MALVKSLAEEKKKHIYYYPPRIARTDRINQWTSILVLLVMLCLEHKTWFSILRHTVKLLFTECNETKKYKEERGEKRDRRSFSSL